MRNAIRKRHRGLSTSLLEYLESWQKKMVPESEPGKKSIITQRISEGQWSMALLLTISKFWPEYPFPTPASAPACSDSSFSGLPPWRPSHHLDGDLSKKDMEGELSVCKC